MSIPHMNLSITSELISLYESGRPVGFNKPPTIAQGPNGEAVYFSINDNRDIYMFAQDPGTDTGWRQENINPEPGTLIAKHIAVGHDRHGRPLLAAVFSRRGRDKFHEIYSLGNLFTGSNDQTRHWKKLCEVQDIQITQLASGVDNNGQSIVVFTGRKGRMATNYLVDTNTDGPLKTPIPIPMPIESKAVLSIQIGHHSRLESLDEVDAVLYCLVDAGGGKTRLVQTSLPDFHFYNREINLDISPTAFGLLTEDDDSELYLADKHLYKLDINAQTQRDPDALRGDKLLQYRLDAQKLPATAKQIINGINAAGQRETWLLCEDGKLYHGSQDDYGRWQPLFLVQKRVATFNAWRNKNNSTLDILTVDTNRNLSHLWQDPQTGRLREREIVLEDVGTVQEKQAYATTVLITDGQGNPLPDVRVTINASEHAFIRVNGLNYFVDPKSDSVVCATDESGKLSMVQTVNSMACPLLQLRFPDITRLLEIDPSASVKQKLFRMSFKEMKSARMQTDTFGKTQALFDRVNSDDLKAAHGVVQKLGKLDLQEGEKTTPPDNIKMLVSEEKGGYCWRPAQNNFTSHTLAANHIPDNFIYGLSFTGKGIKSTTSRRHIQANFFGGGGHRSLSAMATVDFGKALGTVGRFTDVWHLVTQGAEKISHLVIEKAPKGLKVVIGFLNKAFEFVVEYAEQVLEIISVVFKEIRAFIKELVRWLGFIFNWKDILRTKEMIRLMLDKGLDDAEKGLTRLHGKSRDLFNILRKQLGIAHRPADMGHEAHKPGLTLKRFNTISGVFDNPAYSWIMDAFYKAISMVHGRFTPAAQPDPHVAALSVPINDLRKLMDGKIDFDHIVKNFDKMTPAQLLETLLKLMSSKLIDAVEGLSNVLLKITSALAKALRRAVNARWQIPLLTPLYENIISRGSKLNLLELFSLILAIPTTIVFKVANNRTPFQQKDVQNLRNASSLEKWLHPARSVGGSNQARSVTAPGLSAMISSFSSNQVSSGAKVHNQKQNTKQKYSNKTKASDLNLVLSIISGSCTFFYGIFSAIKLNRAGRAAQPVLANYELAKTVFGFMGTTASTINIIRTASLEPDAGKKVLFSLATLITMLQYSITIKDFLVYRANKNARQEDVENLALKTMCIGGINGVLFSILAVVEKLTLKKGTAESIAKWFLMNMTKAIVQWESGKGSANAKFIISLLTTSCLTNIGMAIYRNRIGELSRDY